MRIHLLAMTFGLLASPVFAADWTQVVSREHPKFQVERSRLAIGRDGMIYLASNEYVLRMARDGSQKLGGVVTYALANVAANKEGVVATANAHFNHSVNLWSAKFERLGGVGDFLVNDKVEWMAPCDVQSGASGDFFGLDQNRNRIVRVGAPDRLVTTYSLAQLGEDLTRKLANFRVWEPGRRFYIACPSGTLRVIDFDGKPLWTVQANLLGNPWDGWSGSFDVDDQGRLHVLANAADVVQLFDTDGKPAGNIKLDMGKRKGRVSEFRVWDDDIVLRRPHAIELFQVYDRKTGAFKRVVHAQVEQLRAAFETDVWTAGAAIPLKIDFDAGSAKPSPRWRVWLRPLNTPDFTALAWKDGTIVAPTNAGGLYQVRINADLTGRGAEHQVEGIVEIRQPNAKGAVSIFTPANRIYYGRGESIPLTVKVRSREEKDLPGSLTLRVIDGDKIVHESAVQLNEGAGTLILDAKVSKTLRVGKHVVSVVAPGFTIAGQHLIIGPGLHAPHRFNIVQHGDYSLAVPQATLFDAPEKVADHLARSAALGVNTFVDRLGHNVHLVTQRVQAADWVERLKKDPLSPAPEKAVFETPALQTIAGYGAFGIEQRAILLYMDAGLPIGTGFDARKPEKMVEDVKAVNAALRDYPAFRGWSWAANWWIGKLGAEAAPTPEKKKEYQEALARAHKTGAWSPILDEVSDAMMSHGVEAERLLRKALTPPSPPFSRGGENAPPLNKGASPNASPLATGANIPPLGKGASPDVPPLGKGGPPDVPPLGKGGLGGVNLLSVMTAPYRAVGAHPPIIFQNADEIDLHYQAEQIQPPQVTPHHVDFYKRPGKRAWGHPELWNDDGTGGMIYPTVFQMLMRGADGVGWSGNAPAWPTPLVDGRASGPGAASVYRNLNQLLKTHGPWLTTLDNADRVAIPVSTRMMRLDNWSKIGGKYFDQLFEAYNACLYAHRPASFVFVEDLKPDTLKRFQAVILVGQTVEWDPPLMQALGDAAVAGVRIFYDETCRPELVKSLGGVKTPAGENLPAGLRRPFAGLGVAFNKVEKDSSAWQDDSAYVRFPRYFKEHARVLKEKLNDIAPVADCDQPEVMLTERKLGDARFLWVVNNTMFDQEPDIAWRTGLVMSRRKPVVAHLTLGADAKVFDVFEGKPLVAAGGKVAIDLRTTPARLLQIGGKPLLVKDAAPFREGPRVRSLAISGDRAVLNTFSGDANLHVLDVKSGKVLARRRLGDHRTYAPETLSGGFAVQGFDNSTPEGYHAYLLDHEAAPRMRFALPALPNRATSWANGSHLLDAINHFAYAPDGAWVAGSGNLGLAVWDKGGGLRWKLDWWKTSRPRAPLVTLDAQTLLVLNGSVAAAHDAATGKERWTIKLFETGTLLGGVASSDGGTVALRSDNDGGKVFVLRHGKLVSVLPALADELALSADGNFLAVIARDRLHAFDALRGLLWTDAAPDTLHNLAMSPDGARLVAGDALGHLRVWSRSGERQAIVDEGAWPVARWLPDGGLLVATWRGDVKRYSSELKQLWSAQLDDASPPLAAAVETPSYRLDGWGNAAPTPAPLSDNLLAGTKAMVFVTMSDKRKDWQNPVAMLTDGKPDAPPRPWLGWNDINYIDSGWYGPLHLNVDTFRTQLRVKGITFVEDAKNPQSWLRDLKLQYWDAAAEVWRDGPYLLSNQPVHTHWLEKPIEAARFRFVSSGGGSWPVGNLRLGELVFHGEAVGASHPDAVAKKPVAVLFDEKEDDVQHLKYPGRPFAFRYEDAFSGGKCLALTAEGNTGPAYQPPFGHALPNWDFEIVEKPGPGQYRWLEFAWKATSKETKGMSLLLGRAWPGGGFNIVAGEHPWKEGVLATKKVADMPPRDWQVVRVDLWELYHKQPVRIQALSLASIGGGAAFDRIVLKRE